MVEWKRIKPKKQVLGPFIEIILQKIYERIHEGKGE